MSNSKEDKQKELEQAAREYAKKKDVDRWVFTPEQRHKFCIEDFQAGANWQSNQQTPTPSTIEQGQQGDGWIRVEDGLPKEGGRYWCFCEHIGELGKSYFQWNCAYDPTTKTFNDFSFSFKDGEKVTHWRPLPAPPIK